MSDNGDGNGEPVEALAGLRLFTADEAAVVLRVSPWWLRRKAAERRVPCTFVGRYLRFTEHNLAEIIRAGASAPARPEQPPESVDRQA